MDLDTSERDGGKRIYSRLGPAQDRYQKVCFHWQNGRCSRYPCPFLHSELPPKRANYSSSYSSPDDPRNFQGGGSGFNRRNPNPNPNSTSLSTHNGPNPAVSNHNGPASRWGRSRGGGSGGGGGGGGGARVPTKNPEKMCGYWLKGKCTYGDSCRYLHASSIGETFSFLKLLEGHEQAVSGIALPSASDKLYSGGKDGTVRLWDCQTGQCAAIVTLGDEIGCMISEGPWLFVGLPNVIKAWNIQTNIDLSLSGPVGQVYAMVAINDMLFAGTQDGSILAWRFNVVGNCFEPAAVLAGHQRAVVSMVVGAQRLFSSSMDNTIRVWDLGTLQCVETLTDHTAVVMSVLCWDQFLLSCSLDKTIKVWVATESGKLEVTYTHIEEHKGSRDNYGGQVDLRVIIDGVKKTSQTAEDVLLNDGILSLCGMHDAQAKPVLLCSCNDNCVRIYDLPSFAERGKIFSKEEVRAIQIGPGGLFFTGDGSGELKVWNWLATEQ